VRREFPVCAGDERIDVLAMERLNLQGHQSIRAVVELATKAGRGPRAEHGAPLGERTTFVGCSFHGHAQLIERGVLQVGHKLGVQQAFSSRAC
jgi:hypothetical protein